MGIIILLYEKEQYTVILRDYLFYIHSKIMNKKFDSIHIITTFVL